MLGMAKLMMFIMRIPSRAKPRRTSMDVIRVAVTITPLCILAYVSCYDVHKTGLLPWLDLTAFIESGICSYIRWIVNAYSASPIWLRVDSWRKRAFVRIIFGKMIRQPPLRDQDFDHFTLYRSNPLSGIATSIGDCMAALFIGSEGGF